MRRFVVTLASLIATSVLSAQPAKRPAACAPVNPKADWFVKQRSFADSAGATFTDPALRQQLLAAAGYDSQAAFTPELGFRIIGETPTVVAKDTAVLATLRAMAAKRQWPSRAAVGAAGVHAAWLLSQGDSVLSIAAQRRMMEAGLGESSPAEVAVMEDANRVRQGRGQLYGTHFTRTASGALQMYRLEDPEHVDMRREGAWLPRVSSSECWARGRR
ncbi:MAG: hypothetical protein K2R93_02240 [Gemmatimonadaceae bacterium]|nr:hypothetical protein [Gemmatimonadaceae bacterium]